MKGTAVSAYIVSPAHIQAMLKAGIEASRGSTLRWYTPGAPVLTMDEHNLRTRELRLDTIEEVGAMLLRANVASVTALYGEDHGYTVPAADFNPVHVMQRRRIDAVSMLKAVDGYEYQACEVAYWRESEAYAFCVALRRVLIKSLPGYEDAETWEITE